MTFEKAFERLIGHEGGFQADPNDRANWTTGKIGQGELRGTKYGISAMSYPGEDIRNLTLDRAQAIYRRDYWGPACCDLVPDPVKYPLFSAAVHTSAPGKPTTALRMLQRAAGVRDDGVIGPVSIMAITNMPPHRLLARFVGQYLDYINNNRDQFRLYGVGWSQRAAEMLMEA